jgi:hypothetical protein
MRRARIARRMRPPSIGSAGMRLKAPMTMLIQARRWKKAPSGDSSRDTPPSANDTAGPAAAMAISSPARRGTSTMRAAPPKKWSSMPATRTPR